MHQQKLESNAITANRANSYPLASEPRDPAVHPNIDFSSVPNHPDHHGRGALTFSGRPSGPSPRTQRVARNSSVLLPPAPASAAAFLAEIGIRPFSQNTKHKAAPCKLGRSRFLSARPAPCTRSPTNSPKPPHHPSRAPQRSPNGGGKRGAAIRPRLPEPTVPFPLAGPSPGRGGKLPNTGVRDLPTRPGRLVLGGGSAAPSGGVGPCEPQGPPRGPPPHPGSLRTSLPHGARRDARPGPARAGGRGAEIAVQPAGGSACAPGLTQRARPRSTAPSGEGSGWGRGRGARGAAAGPGGRRTRRKFQNWGPEQLRSWPPEKDRPRRSVRARAKAAARPHLGGGSPPRAVPHQRPRPSPWAAAL
jgi:hypothetical protein